MTNSSRPTTAGLDAFAFYLGRHPTAVRIEARAGRYGALVASTPLGKGSRKINLAEYERLFDTEIDHARLEACEQLHAINLENARLEKLHDFACQRLEEIAAAKELKNGMTQPRRGNPKPKVPPDGPPQ